MFSFAQQRIIKRISLGFLKFKRSESRKVQLDLYATMPQWVRTLFVKLHPHLQVYPCFWMSHTLKVPVNRDFLPGIRICRRRAVFCREKGTDWRKLLELLISTLCLSYVFFVLHAVC